ncbi:DUF6078 family protein [Bacteroides faecichinchillae]|uniref:DUF6078 family protein n=1 Tax=Bacteroides faecichinchillae TaxID=871325 RepID=UPI0035130F09
MEDEFNYQAVPYGYTHCFNTHCPKGEKCLHHLVAMHSTNQYLTLSVVNPNCIPEDANSCPSFHPIRKIRVAWGIKHLLDNVPHKDADSLKRMMLNYFGRGVYYRFYRKEKFIAPEQQEYIQRIFRQKGITDQPIFDSYTEEFEW